VFYLSGGSDSIILNTNIPVEWKTSGSCKNYKGESTLEVYCPILGTGSKIIAISEAKQELTVNVIRQR